MHIVFHRRKKSFLIIEMKVRHCITLQKKNTEKTIILYIKLSDLMLLLYRRQNASSDAELISCKLLFLFLSFWPLLKSILHIYIILYKTIAVGMLEYQSSGQNSIFTLSIFIKLSYNYSFVGKKIKLTGSHFSSYADAFRQLNNT